MTALAVAQGQIGDIPRNRTVLVKTRGGDEYSFRYATLSAIIDAIKKPLSDNGISYTQILSHDHDLGFFYLTTTLHCGDEYISSKVPLISPDGGNQQLGSALTYMKRYTLSAILGISADEDDDGNIADGNTIKEPKTPKEPAPDPISTGRPKKETRPGEFSALKIDVPMLADESGSDWMKWGQNFVGMARMATTEAQLEALKANNFAPLKSMEDTAPKMFTNLSMALIAKTNDLKKEVK